MDVVGFWSIVLSIIVIRLWWKHNMTDHKPAGTKVNKYREEDELITTIIPTIKKDK